MTLTPLYTEDLIYASYLDRLLAKSLGAVAGVCELEDYKVSAGAGLQVNVKAGKAFVEETKAIEESSNSFYNGYYLVPNPTESNPYNAVEVFPANPQIAQIILRVYDVGELKIGGSSFARIEWLNGTANAGATKTHVEEGKASEFGAAVLPQSSLRLAYVVVPKTATKSSEFEIVDGRTHQTNLVQLEPEATSTFMSWGLIASGGTVKSGSHDYGVLKTGEKKYEVFWSIPKSTASYVVLAMPTPAVAVGALVRELSRTTNGFTVSFRTVESSTIIEAEWSFVVVASS